ncbi:GMC oxidoreductase-domain-containing protein [Crucibulum laeve]|uniref:pyranose dehydrogenase (acceptor) n=1 Tax=Crucibulum laeve TaxID=68775 RepID=A0A5C3LUY8_9AGAR|nr:GMC oxidoreductase-domain-containing protein [Crucibulum laeve]
MTSEAETYDIIFAGGGATACVTAGRLAEADPSLKILIIEAGPHTRDIQEHIQPGRYFSNLTLPGETFTFHVANPSDALAGRSVIVPSGRALGGGSSVNFTVYTRAAASDYDDWETTYGNKGWGSKELIPLSKKAETYQAEVFNDTHGSSGPIKVSMATSQFNVGEQFLEVAAAYDKDRKTTKDINAFFSCNEYGRWARYIDGKSGRRSDAPHHYIYPQEKNTNLKVLDRQRVVRIIFEGDRAVGVEYVSDVTGRRQNIVQTPNVARASRLVVIAAGAFGSPSILERSGIGAAEVLKKNNIQQFIDLPGVGENYMDHNLVFVPYIASDDADTMDVIFRGSEDELQPYVKEWTENGRGLMAHNAMDAGIKLRPTAEDLKELGPEFENRWKTYFADKPDKPIMLTGSFAAYTGLNPAAPRRKYFSMTYFTAYPASTGHVHITSGIDPYGKLDFSPGFLDDQADLVVLRWVYKKSREIARRMQMYRGEFDLGHPSFADDKEAAIKLADGPVSISASNIRYTPEDDKAIDDYHRQTVETTWHSARIGTCAMKPREQGGVVNERLNVYGVRNLKVADLSITPDNVGGNTYNTALTVGEKAAVIIAEDLGIKGVTVA